jgi:DNA-nicking Smr family endonuclease
MAKARSRRSSGATPARAKPDADGPRGDDPGVRGLKDDERDANGRDPPAQAPSAASEDAGLFRAAVRDVRPLPPTARLAPAPREDRRGARRHAARAHLASEARVDDFPDVALEEDSPTGADTLSFRRPGVRDRTLKQLRRGLYPIEDDLDLHGLSQAAARDSLGEFLAYSRGAGYRCVRIVHGKGYRSGARGPILKISVNAWLKRHADVMAFTSARPIDGGAGAVYVLLRA